MSMAPCQVCGGTGFIDERVDVQSPTDEERELDPHADAGHFERAKVPCPICSAAGTSAAL